MICDKQFEDVVFEFDEDGLSQKYEVGMASEMMVTLLGDDAVFMVMGYGTDDTGVFLAGINMATMEFATPGDTGFTAGMYDFYIKGMKYVQLRIYPETSTITARVTE